MHSFLLAYSGGLDTSVAIHWLRHRYRAEVHCLIVDVGQEEDLEEIQSRALRNGAKSVVVHDAREEFARDYVFKMLPGHPAYEYSYLLGSAISRPLIAKHLFETGAALQVEALAHGATGKGNDQFRFELSLAALGNTRPVIAPWREWSFGSRSDLVDYAAQHDVALEENTTVEKPLSIDRNLVHTSYEGDLLEDPERPAPTHAFDRVRDFEDATEAGADMTISFRKGLPVAVDGANLSPLALMVQLNQLGSDNAIGRTDHVESRFIGMKSRNVYETPGLTILYAAHRAAEAMCLDKEVLFLKEELMPRYARQIYDGLWFTKQREMVQASLDAGNETVNADISLHLERGTITITRRHSESSLYDVQLSSIEEDRDFDHTDATGYIRLLSTSVKFQPKQSVDVAYPRVSPEIPARRPA
ncbi:MAG: argininosuccinate synthase [Litoreibacter sp.]